MWQTQLCPLIQEKLSKVSAFEPATTDMRATLWAILTRFSTTSFGAAPSCFSKPNRIWHRPGWLARKPALICMTLEPYFSLDTIGCMGVMKP